MYVVSVPDYKERSEPLPTLEDLLRRRTGFHLQDRDIDILEALYLRRFLSTTQLWWEFFRTKKASQRACQIRLAKLYKLGLVDRFRPPAQLYEGSNPYVYVLDQLGFQLLRHLRGERGITRWDHQEKLIQLSRVWHELELNTFCLLLVQAAQERGLQPVWWTTRQCVQRISGAVGREGPLYQPDAIIQWIAQDGKPIVLHVEYERTADPRWFLEKLRNWRVYRQRELWKKKGYPAEPRILVVGHRRATPTHGSILPLRNAATAHQFDGIFFLAVEDMMLSHDDRRFWQVLEDGQMVAPEQWPVFTSHDIEVPNPDPDPKHPTITQWEQTTIWDLYERSPWERPPIDDSEESA